MPFSLPTFADLRPFLYHLTATSNIPRITQLGQLIPAAQLFQSAGQPEAIRERRRASVTIHIDGSPIHIRDQAPLHQGNAGLQGNWSFDDLVEDLNHRVFFWPGDATGPISYGRRHFERYQHDNCSVLRFPTAALFAAAAPTTPPQFCRYNSGSPRCTQGHPSPRGPTTFLPAETIDATPGKVIEVTFRGTVHLPPGPPEVLNPSQLL